VDKKICAHKVSFIYKNRLCQKYLTSRNRGVLQRQLDSYSKKWWNKKMYCAAV